MFFLAPGVIDFQVAALFEPAIQIDASAERIEAVVGDNHQQRVLAPAFGHGPAYQIIHASIKIFDHVAVFHGNFFGSRGMVYIKVPPEHVLHAIRAVKYAHTQAALDLVKAIEKHQLALPVEVETLLDEMLVAENVLVEPPGVLGQAKRRKGTLPFRQVDGINGGKADRHRRLFGVNIHGGRIQLEVGLGIEQEEFAYTVHLDARRDAKANSDPIGILVLVKLVVDSVNLENGAITVFDRHHKAYLQRAQVLAERML